MFGIILVSIGTFFEEVSDSIGKVKVSLRQESPYTMAFLSLFWGTVLFALIALIEAMAHGVVPIISNVEGHKDLVIDGKNGFLCNEQIDLVNSIFKSQLMSVSDYKQMKKSAKNTIINLLRLAKKNIKNNFKIYE